jgi:3-isopropylmalate dehydrogenase
VIPGDGIGKDVTAEAVKALRAVSDVSGRALDLEMLPWSADYFLETGVTLPPNGYAMLRDDFDAVFVGALGDPRVPDNRHARDILLGTRFELDLYINYRPVKLLADRLCPLKGRGCADVDFVVFRENTEGLYMGIGGRFKAGTPDEVAIQEEINTYKGVHRIIQAAFAHAVARGGRRCAWPTKQCDDGATRWRQVFAEVAAEFRNQPTRIFRHVADQESAPFQVIAPTCSVTSSRIWAARCRAALAWPRRATFIPDAPRCSNRCTGRRRGMPARISRTRLGRFCRRP